jgi:hypothetical protein
MFKNASRHWKGRRTPIIGKRFDHVAFAEKQKVSLDWLIDGTLNLASPHASAPT